MAVHLQVGCLKDRIYGHGYWRDKFKTYKTTDKSPACNPQHTYSNITNDPNKVTCVLCKKSMKARGLRKEVTSKVKQEVQNSKEQELREEINKALETCLENFDKETVRDKEVFVHIQEPSLDELTSTTVVNAFEVKITITPVKFGFKKL